MKVWSYRHNSKQIANSAAFSPKYRHRTEGNIVSNIKYFISKIPEFENLVLRVGECACSFDTLLDKVLTMKYC